MISILHPIERIRKLPRLFIAGTIFAMPFGSLPRATTTTASARCYGFVSLHRNRRWEKRTRNIRCYSTASHVENGVLPASRIGLDPRSNKRHCPLVYHEDYSFADWPPEHTFPMNKFERLANAILTSPITDLNDDPLVLDPSHFFRPLDYTSTNLATIQKWLCGPLNATFVDRFLQGRLTAEEVRLIGFREQTYRPELIRRTVLELAGTLLTAHLACQYGVAANLAGGTHHAHHEMGAGYTILNDLVVTAHQMTTTTTTTNSPGSTTSISLGNNSASVLQRVLVIDCDVHQGDGTARCMQEIPSLSGKLFTLSLHCESNYPHPKARSTFDVGLPDKMKDEAYLKVLHESVDHAITKVQPDLVLYDAGVDVYRHDKLGRLHVSEEGIRKRDRYVLEACVSRNIPVAAVIGGGYDSDEDALARRHAILHEECSKVWRERKMWKK